MIEKHLQNLQNVVAKQFDNIDLSPLDNEMQAKIKLNIDNLKIKVKSGNLDLQEDINKIISEISGNK